MVTKIILTFLVISDTRNTVAPMEHGSVTCRPFVKDYERQTNGPNDQPTNGRADRKDNREVTLPRKIR